MTGREIYGKLNEIAPFAYAADWDHSGVQVGSLDRTVHRIMLALDPTEDVIRQAVDAGVDLLITHHPLLFGGVRSITEETPVGRKIIRLLENRICCIGMHTNADATLLAEDAIERLGLDDVVVLDPAGMWEGIAFGYGRVGELPAAMPLMECVDALKRAYNLPEVHIYGKTDDWIKRVAILPGSGGDEIEEAIRLGADLYITGDIKHHAGVDATECGIVVIDATHYGLEKVFPALLKERLEEQIPDIEILCARETSPCVIQ
ncbi:MAG: Nif3-like dinuclear metal center hexameric protein [Lachnospiraceae bacterium]